MAWPGNAWDGIHIVFAVAVCVPCLVLSACVIYATPFTILALWRDYWRLLLSVRDLHEEARKDRNAEAEVHRRD